MIDIEEKINENKSKSNKIFGWTIGSILTIGFVIGLVLTIVNGMKPHIKTADEIRSTYALPDALKKTKSVDYKIENLGFITKENHGDLIRYFDDLTITANIDSKDGKDIIYTAIYDEEIFNYSGEEVVKVMLEDLVTKMYYHKIINSFGSGKIYNVHENKLLVDKNVGEGYYYFDDNGVLLEAYMPGQYSVNKGLYYHE